MHECKLLLNPLLLERPFLQGRNDFRSILLLTLDPTDWTTFLGDLFSFDPATNSWTEMPPAFDGNFTVARNSMGITSIGELLYVFGGYNIVDSYGVFEFDGGARSELLALPCETLRLVPDFSALWIERAPRTNMR